MELKFEVNTQEIVDKVLEKVKDEFIPKSVIEDIKAEIYKARTNISFNLSEEKSKWVNSGIYDGLMWAEEIIDKHIGGAKMVEPQETETWNGYHGQITAPKGTFEKIYEDAESEG